MAHASLAQLYLGIDAHVLGRRIAAFRKQHNKTQDELATLVGVSRPLINQIEAGERLPKEHELRKLAEIFATTIARLLRPEEPSEPLQVQFRKVKGIDAATEQEAETRVRELEQLCEDYVRLETYRECPLPFTRMPPYPSEHLKPEDAGQQLAARERSRLNFGDGPILNVRTVLENEGLRIFQIKLPSKVSGFFGFTQSLGPCMAVNISHPIERRHWTMAHEYGHYLTKERFAGKVTVCFSGELVSDSEKLADAFARNFLLPATSVAYRFHELKRQRNDQFLPADLVLLAHYFGASIEAMAHRLEELRLTREGMYDRLKANGFQPAKAQAQLGLTPPIEDQEMLPWRYQYLACEAFEQEQITERTLAEFLRMDLAQARQRYMQIRTQSLLSNSGTTTTINLALTDNMGA
jgi:Zn-dependent peptidase ImmA (M78 family)/transcriptional regulator with XRE-family HTH domain